MADAIGSSERWLPIEGWEGLYEVSDHGQVRGLGVRGHILRGRLSHDYRLVALNRDRTRCYRSVHRLVLFAFVGPPPKGHECNHKDGNRANNHLSNLEWVTHRANCQHACDTGLKTPTRGELSGKAKLTAERVREIRRLRGVLPIGRIAERFGVHPRTIRSVWYGESWGWLE